MTQKIRCPVHTIRTFIAMNRDQIGVLPGLDKDWDDIPNSFDPTAEHIDHFHNTGRRALPPQE